MKKAAHDSAVTPPVEKVCLVTFTFPCPPPERRPPERPPPEDEEDLKNEEDELPPPPPELKELLDLNDPPELNPELAPLELSPSTFSPGPIKLTGRIWLAKTLV